jgi:hypothetical protein
MTQTLNSQDLAKPKIFFIASLGETGKSGKKTFIPELTTNLEFLKILAFFEFDDELNP